MKSYFPTRRNISRVLSILLVTVMLFSTFAIHRTAHAEDSEKKVNEDAVPPLLITEVVPQSSRVNSVDGFEFIEVYNNTNQVIDFADYQIIYRYPVGPEDDAIWTPNKRDIQIEPGKALVLWIENSGNKDTPVADFNEVYGSDLIENENIVKMPGGMANQRMRDIIIRTNTGEEIVAAQYNKATLDVEENLGIFYQYPQDGSNQMVKVSAAEKMGTPGIVESELVPENPVIIAPEQAPRVEDQTKFQQPIDHVQVAAEAEDDFLITTMTLFYKGKEDEEYHSLQLEKDEQGTYHHQIPIQHLIDKEEIEYYLEASNGFKQTSTDKNSITITEAENNQVPPLFITEVVPDSSNLNGADAYEFIEVFNNTNQPLNFGDFHIIYRYPTGSEAVWFEGLTDIMIEPGSPLVLWVENGKNDEVTVADFNENYGTDLEENVDIVKASAGGGMANGAERDLVISTNTNDEIAVAGYNKATNDVYENMGIFYHFPIGSNELIKVRDNEPATPGTVEADLIPTDLQSIDSNTEPVIQNQTEIESAQSGEKVDIRATVEDDFLVADVKLFYKGAEEADFQSVSLTSGEETGLFQSTIEFGNDDLQYYFVASNGFNQTKTETFTLEKEKIVEPANLQSPENHATDLETDIDLSVTIPNEEEEMLDVHFYEGLSINTAQDQQMKIYKNAVDTEPPAERVPAGETEFTEEEYEILRDSKDGKITTDAEGEFPYHRFEIPLDEVSLQQNEVEIVWQGSSLEGRKVTMYAWNFDSSKWEIVDFLVADSEEIFSLKGEVHIENYVRDGVINVLVQDEIPPREEYDYSFVWLSDTQFYTEVFPELYESQVNWIVDKKDELNIEYVFHTGDIVNTYNQMYQWEFADQYMKILEDADVPYGVLAGNHDIQLRPEIDYTNYYAYFGEDRFLHQPYYGGSYQNNRGHYDLISSHGMDFIMVYMGWQPDENGIKWMNEVLAQYPDRFAVLNLHEYLNGNGERSNIGERIYQDVVLPNENVKLVLGGHYHGSEVLLKNASQPIRVLSTEVDDNEDGTPNRVVHQLLGNFQDANRGGDGYMNVMNIDMERDKIYVNTYSPTLDDYDLFPPYTLELDLEPMTKRVSTNYLAINAYVDQKIDTVSKRFTDDELLTVPWNHLDENKTYYWYTMIENEEGEKARSTMWSFSTGKQEEIVSIGDVRILLDEFIADDKVRKPLSNQLANTLKQAEHHKQKEHKKQAIKFLQKFLDTVDKQQMQKHIAPEAKDTLQQQIQELVNEWEKG
ncbi:hypothetical protein J14TS2_22690 [Bacillus sp. J14TS2]|uniref:FIMAH domain-containing protein n=1 Tax=Bacillus sp. J14TS2 TaxID=2807188 RepID=UPI001B16261B|nr:lamin tail domain-containing protein [Bacillus sp. J14TS2]GIN71794.1 hypothetical protein J14TS2_22690 [Bacillus sp. J14TS2]